MRRGRNGSRPPPAERSPGPPTPPARFTASRMIAGIVLAAGFARRMGRQKLLLQLEGKPVVRWVVEGLLPRVEDVVVVTGHDDSAVRDALAGLAARFAGNARPERVERVVFDLPMPPDVDTPEDYARLHVQ